MAKRFTISAGTSGYVKGLEGINAKLIALGKKAGTDALYEGLYEISEPLARDMAARTPVDEGHLRESIVVSRRLTSNQEKQRRSYRARVIKQKLGMANRQRLSKEDARAIHHTAQLFVGVAQRRGKTSQESVQDDPNQYAHLVEWGTSDTPAQPFARPAWDAWKVKAIVTFARFMKRKLGM